MAFEKSKLEDFRGSERNEDVKSTGSEDIHYQTAENYDDFMAQFSQVENKAPYTYHVSAESKDFRKAVSAVDIIGTNNKEVPKIRWEMNHKCDSFPIKFTGIPYIWLGRQVWHCTCAKDKNAFKSLRLQQSDASTTDMLNNHIVFPSTKKVQCQVKFMVKKIMIFPSYKIEKDTRSKRDVISHTLRKTLKTLSDSKGSIPSNESQLGITQYLWQYPSGIHINMMNSPQVSANGGGSIDKRVETYIHSLLCDGVTELSEIQTKIKEYVNNVLFLRPVQENRFSRQFLPDNKKLREIVHQILLQERNSKTCDSGLEDLYMYWHKTAYVYFKPHLRKSILKKEVESVNGTRDDKDQVVDVNSEDNNNSDDNDDDTDTSEDVYSSLHFQQNVDDNGKMAFVYMSAQMMRFYRLYASNLIILETTYRSIHFPVPLYFLVVQANLHHQIVAIISVQEETKEMLANALQIIKGWVPDISPKYGIVNQISPEKYALEDVFPQIKTFCSDASRESNWNQHLSHFFTGKSSDTATCAGDYMRALARADSEKELHEARENIFSWDKYKGKFKTWLENVWMSFIECWCMFYRPPDLMPVSTSRGRIESLHVPLWYNELKLHNKCSLSEILIILIEKFLPKHCTTFTPVQQRTASWEKDYYESYKTKDPYMKKRTCSVSIDKNITYDKNISYSKEYSSPMNRLYPESRKRTYSTSNKGHMQSAIQLLIKYTQTLNDENFIDELTREIKRITDNTKRHIENDNYRLCGKEKYPPKLYPKKEEDMYYNGSSHGSYSNKSSLSSLRSNQMKYDDSSNRYMQLLQYEAMKRLLRKDPGPSSTNGTNSVYDDVLDSEKRQVFKNYDKTSKHDSIFRRVMRKPSPRIKKYVTPDIDVILHNQFEINEQLINLSQNILHFQFPNLNGFLNTNSEMIYQKNPFVQIVRNYNSISHWATISSFHDNEATYHDSLILSREYLIPPLTIRTISHVVHCTEPTLNIYINPVQQQSSSLASGYYAIAFSVDLAFGNNPNSLDYDETRFSYHLAKCLRQYRFEPFPRLTTNSSSRHTSPSSSSTVAMRRCEGLTQSANVFCVCRDIFLPDDPINDVGLFMALCVTCCEWYHCACVQIPNDVLTDERMRKSWKCHNCA